MVVIGFPEAKASEQNDLGMFKGRKLSELPDYYRDINTPSKLEAYRKKLEAVPQNAVVTKIDGQTYRCIDRGGHDLESGMKVYDMRCWKN
ncbi:MAG: hypothetical protein HC778_00100 [Chamaesiphon sp. CSU_1_12]|nr:hypothetical protein [Chamaesiphon sp. CSU_1_12]